MSQLEATIEVPRPAVVREKIGNLFRELKIARKLLELSKVVHTDGERTPAVPPVQSAAASRR